MDKRLSRWQGFGPRLGQHASRLHRMAGVSLIEALIALVVFSVALLGLAGMYAKALSVGHSSYLRALANIHAVDFEERIRANPQADADNYVFSCTATGVPESIALADNNMAEDDRDDWCANGVGLFGDSWKSATVTSDGTNFVDFTVNITWTERKLTDNNRQDVSDQTFTYTIRRIR